MTAIGQVAFRVPFCPTELPALVREFSTLALAL